MIDWRLAGHVGALVAGDEPAPARAGAEHRLAAIAADARSRVVAHTGLRPLAPIPDAESVGRRAWVDANLRTMRGTLAPLAERIEARASAPARAAGGLLLGLEVGGLAGLMAQRVLGQYDVALRDPQAPPRLLIVAPNLGELAGRLELDEDELVRWVVFHEVTHAVQFSAVPWLRDHLGELVGELLGSIDVEMDPRALLRLPAPDDVRALVEAVRSGGLVTALAGPERRAVLDRLQATMALVEGHAEHVMDAVGAEVLPSLERLRAALDRRRRERSLAWRLLERLVGLDLKLRQYEEGRRFCAAVVREAGMDGLNRAWSAPELLPTAGEIAAPERWLARAAL